MQDPEQTKTGSPEERVSFLLHRLNASMSRVSNPLFKQYGLDAITARILVVTLHRPHSFVGDIVRALGLPQSTVSHQIKRLENMGYLIREKDRLDARSFKVTLTGNGMSVAEECDARSQRLNDLVTAELQEKDSQVFFDAVHQLLSFMEALDQDRLIHDSGTPPTREQGSR